MNHDTKLDEEFRAILGEVNGVPCGWDGSTIGGTEGQCPELAVWAIHFHTICGGNKAVEPPYLELLCRKHFSVLRATVGHAGCLACGSILEHLDHIVSLVEPL